MTWKRFTSGSTARLVVTGLVCWALAGTAYAVLRLTYGARPVNVNVRWAATVDDAARLQLEQRYTLARPDPQGDRTFSYALTDRSLENISNLVRDPAIEDTHQIDRSAFRVESSAPSLRYAGIPAGLEYLSVLGFLGGLASIGLALLTRSPTLVRWCSTVLGLLGGPASIGLALLTRSPTLLRWKRFTSGSTARLVVTGLVCWALAGTAYAVLRLTYGDRPVHVNVRWAATVDDAARAQLEQRYTLARPAPQGDRTFIYALTDRSLENISNLVRDPAIEDTHRIDRPALRVESSAPSVRYAGIPAGLEYLSVLGFLGGLVSLGRALFNRLVSLGRALITRSPTLVQWIGVLDRLLARNQGLIRSALIGLILLLPALSITGLASVYLGQSLANFHPQWSDAIMYWHQIKTFAAVGFSGGYYTVGEEAAAASFTHFYTWGPWYIALYGLIGKVVGWNLWSPMLFDVAAVTLALLGAVLLIRPNSRQLVLVLLVLLTYWPLHLYLPRAMQEPFHYAVAILLAGIFYRVLLHEDAMPHRLLAAALVMIVGAALVRPTWAVLLLPLVTIVVEKRPRGRATRGSRFRQVFCGWPFLTACAVVAGIFLLSRYVAAPFPHRVMSDVQLLLSSPIDGVQRLLAVTTAQGMTYLWPDHDHPLGTLLRYQALGIVLWMTVLAFRRRGNDVGPGAPGRPPWRWAERCTHILNLSLIILLVLMLWRVGPDGDYRVVAPHLLLSLLLLAACGRGRVVAVAVLAGLLLTPSFLAAYNDRTPPQFTDEQARIDAFAAQTAGALVYQAQGDPWCNTILLPLRIAFRPESLAIPAGIGISFDFDDSSRSELKSRYVMVDDESRESMTEAFDLQFAATTALGDLYRNAGISCTD